MINSLPNITLDVLLISGYTDEITNKLSFSVHLLHHIGFRLNSDFFINEDADFMKVIFVTRMLMNRTLCLRIDSPRMNSLHLNSQLFLAQNGIIELGWLEREFYAIDQAKFDGNLFKSISPVLIKLE
ncbi:hypothetical protein A0J61_09852 [Choanephora cucurbitarum]|uniref:Uncharacterized protein n=1 Tax=Choanephora cucurbitarum TaxID=101091 RepID=A0A1C7N099_9FUNG|nr:hypothetical protein A0J61_09852 [Choanephora cucurbitarum]